jgi:hypothetical protein
VVRVDFDDFSVTMRLHGVYAFAWATFAPKITAYAHPTMHSDVPPHACVVRLWGLLEGVGNDRAAYAVGLESIRVKGALSLSPISMHTGTPLLTGAFRGSRPQAEHARHAAQRTTHAAPAPLRARACVHEYHANTCNPSTTYLRRGRDLEERRH